MTKQHGAITPRNRTPADPLGRGVHGLAGFEPVADEAARLAIVQTAEDRTRFIEQTGGTHPGYYIADGMGGWFYLGGTLLGSYSVSQHASRHEPGGTDEITTLPAHYLTHQAGGADEVFLDQTLAPLTLYVDDATGNDANDGSSTYPLKTLIEARDRIPYRVLHPVRIFVADHTGVGYEWPTFGPHAMKPHINIYVHGGWRLWSGTEWVEDPTHTGKTIVVASTAALAGSDNDVVKSSGLVANAYQGYSLEILDGDATGSVKTIRNNTTTDIIPCHILADTVAEGDHYQIFRPSVKLTFGECNGLLADAMGSSQYQELYDSWVLALPKSSGCGLVLINFKSANNDDWKLRCNNSTVTMYGFESTTTQTDFFGSGHIKLGYDSRDSGPYPCNAASLYLDLSFPSIFSASGWGFAKVGGSYLFCYNLNAFEGCIVSTTVAFSYAGGTRASLFGGKVPRIVYNNGYAAPSGVDTHPVLYCTGRGGLDFLIDNSAASAAVWCASGDILLNRCTISSAGDGIVVECEGRAGGFYLTSGTITGVAVKTTKGGAFRYAVAPTLTGVAGDLSEDNGLTIRPNASLTNGTSFVNLGDLSKISRRDI